MQGHKFNANSRAKTRCYVINNSTNKKLTFQFNPSKIDRGRSANYVEITSPGASYPLTQYVSGNAISFSFDVFYYDKPYSGKIQKATKFLDALLPPQKNKKSFVKPPTFTLAYGHLVKTYVLTAYDIKDEWLDSNGKPIMCTYTLSVRQVK